MYDAASVMRFVAWRGLSEHYRAAVDGHSPWKAEDKEAVPISINNVELMADITPELKTAVNREGIAALAFIPIFSDAKIVGKFMAYYDAPHGFSQAELDAGVAISRQLGFGIERLRAEQSTRQLATIVDTSDDAIISKNLDGVIQTWNRGAERIFGYMAEEVLGKPVTILMPPDRYDEEPGILARLRAGQRIEHYETVRRRKNGELLDVSLTVSPIRDSSGRVVAASKIARDITEQKRAEAALRDNERRLKELLAAIPAAIYTTDAAGKITYYNDAAVDFAGRRPVLGSDEWCVSLKLFWPDGTPLPHDQCPMAIALKEDRPIRGKEAVAERPDGTRIPFIPFPTPLHDADGRLIGAINMLIDVSERKQAEAQQHVLMRELNHRVKNNMQMLQSLLFTASRQTRNSEARDVLNDVSRRIAAMSAAQGTLYSSKGANRFSSTQFVQAVCSAAQQSFPSGVEVVRQVDPFELENDSAMPLALILNELLTNAVKYGTKGGTRGIIRVGFNKQDSYELYVEDDGPGFDLHEVKDRSSGLKLVQLLARQLRGQLNVSRAPATRCTIRFK
jgi:PAS domain S-box-containing protein